MIHYTDLSGITEEEPREYTIGNIAFHEPTSRIVRDQRKGKSILLKAKIFLERGCIIPVSGTEWNCLPIEDYNKRTYRITLTPDGFTCECQGFRKKLYDLENGKTDDTPICSHILSVRQFCFMEEKNKIKRGEGE